MGSPIPRRSAALAVFLLAVVASEIGAPAAAAIATSQEARPQPAAFAEALALAEARVAELRAGAQPDPAALADALEAVIAIRVRMASSQPALLEEAVALREAAGDVDALVATLLLQFEVFEARQGALGIQAAAALERARALADGRWARGHPMELRVRARVGLRHYRQGQYGEARAVLTSVIHDSDALAPPPPDLRRALFWLGLTEQTTRNFDAALAALTRARVLSAERSDVWEVAQIDGLRGHVLAEIGDYAGARVALDAAVDGHAASVGPDHWHTARVWMDIGQLFAVTGDHRRAIQYYARAWPSMDVNRQLPWEVLASRYADSLLVLGDVAKARTIIEPALAQVEARGVDDANTSLVLAVYAFLLRSEGRFAEAREYSSRSLDLRLRLGLAVPAATSLLELARLAVAEGRTAEARDHYARALETMERARRHHPSTRVAQAEYAELLARDGDLDLAAAHAAGAAELSLSLARLAFRGQPESVALAYTALHRRNLDLMIALTGRAGAADAGQLDRAFDYVVRSRAIVLDEVARRQGVASSGAAAPEAARLRDAREAMARLVVRGPEPGGDGPYAAAAAEVERAEEALAVASAGFRDARAADNASGAVVRAHLGAGRGLVAYVRYIDPSVTPVTARYGAFVVGPEGGLRFVGLGAASAIDAAVSATRRQLLLEAEAAGRASARLLAGYRAAALELRRLVWDPVAADVMGASTVFLVPDGALHLVNVSALPDGDHGYLLETGPTIHYLAAERDLAMPARTSRAGGLLAVGNPRFDDGATPVSSSPRLRSALCGGLGGLHFGPLAASARESEEVAALWTGRHGGATVLSETAATEAAFKAQAAGHRVLHLATHGYFLDEDCDVAGEAATPADGAAATGALLRAGLAFAGANQRAGALASDDDGVVTAAEVASLDLSGVEWAVLSACDTGLGSIATGEGVFGLQRAFRVAGASTVIMSLWPVDDEATRAWMTRLYRARLDEGRDTAAAVRAAALQTLEARRRGGRSTHPFYWAGFIASGDWR